MILATLGGSHLVFIVGVINVAVGLVCLSGWLLIGRLKLAKEVPDIAGRRD